MSVTQLHMFLSIGKLYLGKRCFSLLRIPIDRQPLCDNNEGCILFGVSLIGTHFFIFYFQKGKHLMKYCAKCGTQMSDDTVVCPKCHPEINNLSSQHQNQVTTIKNTNSKSNPLILINIIISALTLIAVIVMHFIPLSINDTTNNNDNLNDNSNSHSNNVTSTCPASEYGNHNWSRATCQEPSYCYDCNAEKDGKLGNHYWDVDELGNRYCWDCGIPYSD